MTVWKWLLCFAAIALALGIPAFFLGERLPRRWFDARSFAFRCHGWEKGGRVYDAVRVRAWKDRFPDMSRIMPGTFAKKVPLTRDPKQMRRLIEETCSAEAVHWALIVASPIFPLLMGKSGFLAMALYDVAGNLAPIVIQRYNRPRMLRVLESMENAARPAEKNA